MYGQVFGFTINAEGVSKTGTPSENLSLDWEAKGLV
jgi:hypothetical protein